MSHLLLKDDSHYNSSYVNAISTHFKISFSNKKVLIMHISPSLRMVLIIKTHLVVHAQMFWVKGLAKGQLLRMSGKDTFTYFPLILLHSTAVSIFVVILVELTSTVFVYKY